MTPNKSLSFVFIMSFYFHSSKLLSLQKSFLLERNCPSFAIGNETFHMTAIPDSYYHHSHYGSNPLSMGGKNIIENQVVHPLQRQILIFSYQLHVVDQRVSMLPCFLSVTTQLHSVNLLQTFE